MAHDDSELSLAQLEGLLARRRRALEALEKERVRLVHQLDIVDRKITALAGSSETKARALRQRWSVHTTPGGRVRNDSSLVETMDQVMNRAGAPMRVGDILDAVLASGYRTKSANFRNIINQTLIKESRFVQTARGTYTIRK